MTVHKLNAGDGYVYLTKHVAAGDATESRKAGAVDYYVAKGTPPGIWCGKLAEKVGIEIGAEVTEDGMRSVFGAARTPDAFATRPGSDAPLSERLEWSRRTALGRAFSWFEKSQEYVNDVEERCTAYKAQYGTYPDSDAKKSIQLSTARTHLLRGKSKNADLLSDDTVWKYITDQYGKVRQPVAGYDLVFTPMKSVSLLWGLGDERVKAAVEGAHMQAVDEALDWIEDEVIYTRRGAGGVRKVKADGLLIARFDHFDNRAGDPNLHTHSAILNRVLAEGRWTTIDGSVLYKANVAASERYNTRVADLVARALGVIFTPRPGTPAGKQPVYEVDGIPLTLIEEFSRRSAIEARQEELARTYRDTYGKNPPKKVQYAQAQQATLDTRNAKNPPRSLAELRAEWRQRTEAILPDTDPDELIASVREDRDQRPPLDPKHLPILAAEVVETLSRKAGSWTVFSLTAEVQRRLREFSFPDDNAMQTRYEDAMELALRDYCLPTYTEVYNAPERISERVERGLIRMQTVDRAQMRYTAQPVLDAEQFMREQAEQGDDRTVSPFVIRRQIRRAERNTGHSLGDDQIAMIQHFLTAKKRVAVAVGAAGAGKTTAAAVIARAWESRHGQVLALGPSARAAEVLGAEIEVEGRTIADVLTRRRAGIPTGISAGDLLLVDEAGMASARDLADLTEVAAEAGAVIRLLGDPQQLASVETGGVLRDLADRTNAPFLQKVHRFTTSGEAQASLLLRSGDDKALRWYDKHDRIRDAMAHDLPDVVFDAYVADIEDDQVALMVAPTNDLVRALNEKAAAYYRANGTVTGPGLTLADGLEGAVGDVVVTRKNNSKYVVKGVDGAQSGRVKNGDLWTITELGMDGSLRLRNNISGGQVTVAADYITDNVQLGYATTVHRSQGMTVGNCHVLTVSGMDRQSLYVAMTRGKNTNLVYAANDELPDWDFEHLPDEHPGAFGVLAGILARDGSQRAVHQQIEDEQREAASWARITRIYHLAVGALYEEYTEELLGQMLTERQFAWVHDLGGWDKIVTCITQCETFGWDTRALVTDAIAEVRRASQAGELDETKNAPGQVLARTLKNRIDSDGGETLVRARSDEVAHYRVPALSDAAAALDPALASYARAQQQQMHAFIDSYTTVALEQGALWLTAMGAPGSDPRQIAQWERTVREVARSRVLADAPETEHDPLTYLREERRDEVAARITRWTSRPGRKRGSPSYGRHSDAELAAARRSSVQRLGETRRVLALAHQELERVSGRDSAAAVVEQRAAEIDHQQIAIRSVRSARAHLEALQRSGVAGAQQLADAQSEMLAAERAAPPEQQWPIIERTAQYDQAQAARTERAQVIDEQAIGRVRDRITRLEESQQAEEGVLGLIDEERARRSGDRGTRGPRAGREQGRSHRGRARETGPGSEPDHTGHDHDVDRGPDLDV